MTEVSTTMTNSSVDFAWAFERDDCAVSAMVDWAFDFANGVVMSNDQMFGVVSGMGDVRRVDFWID